MFPATNQYRQVSAVVTSCDRHDLLDQTIDSFYRFNSFPIDQFIVVEDGRNPPLHLKNAFPRLDIQVLSTGERVGQIAAIDYAYSRIQNPYVFHMEDDWAFYAKGFMEKSMRILEAEPTCLQVWIRSLEDTNGHLFSDKEFRKGRVKWRRMLTHYRDVWHGFTFNPGLRRFSDYLLSNGYGNLTTYRFERPGLSERDIGEFYRRAGFHAAILSDQGGKGYVRHIGGQRRVGPIEKLAE